MKKAFLYWIIVSLFLLSTAGAYEFGYFPDGSVLQTIPSYEIDGYNHVVGSVTEFGNLIFLVLQPDGRIGRTWDGYYRVYFSQAYCDWRGSNRFYIYVRDIGRDWVYLTTFYARVDGEGRETYKYRTEGDFLIQSLLDKMLQKGDQP